MQFHCLVMLKLHKGQYFGIIAPIAASPDAGYGGFFYPRSAWIYFILHYLRKGGDGYGRL